MLSYRILDHKTDRVCKRVSNRTWSGTFTCSIANRTVLTLLQVWGLPFLKTWLCKHHDIEKK